MLGTFSEVLYPGAMVFLEERDTHTENRPQIALNNHAIRTLIYFITPNLIFPRFGDPIEASVRAKRAINSGCTRLGTVLCAWNSNRYIQFHVRHTALEV